LRKLFLLFLSLSLYLACMPLLMSGHTTETTALATVLYLSASTIIIAVLTRGFNLKVWRAKTFLIFAFGYAVFLFVPSYFPSSESTASAVCGFLFMIVATAMVLVKKVKRPSRFLNLQTLFIVALVMGVLLRLFFMQFTAPTRDVPYLDEKACGVLLSGQNPYTATYENIAYIPAEAKWTILPYLPFTIIYLTPFHLMGDVRLGGVFADITIAICIFLILRKRSENVAFLLSVFYVFFPLSISCTSLWGYNTMVGVSLLMLAFLFLSRNKFIFSGIFFGLAIAALQFVIFLIPFILVYAYRKRQLMRLGLVPLISSSIIIIPFALENLGEFWFDTFGCKMATDFCWWFNNMSLSGLVACLGAPGAIPAFWRVVVLLPIMFILLQKTKSFDKLMINTTVFTLIFLFVFPKELYLNYLLMPIALILASVFPERGHVKHKRGGLLSGFVNRLKGSHRKNRS